MGDLVVWAPSVTSATGFASGDVGKTITGTGIPGSTTIASLSSDLKTATLSAAPTIEGTGVTFTVDATGRNGSLTDGVVHTGLTVTAASGFTTADSTKVIAAAGIPTGATLTVGSNGTTATLSAAATASAAGVKAAIGASATITTSSGAYTGGTFNASQVTVVSGTKMVVKAPYWAPAAKYNVCVMDNAGTMSGTSLAKANTLASTTYTIYGAPTGVSVTPASGPAGSSTVITISGTNLGTPTATLGGVALTLKAVTGSTTDFTATAPAHAFGDVPLVVSSPGGPATVTFTYKDSIAVLPNTAVLGSSTVLDINGAGFLGTTTQPMSFDGTSAGAKVILVKGGTYVGLTTGGTGASAECTNVTVVSDQELICTLDTTQDTHIAPASTTSPVVPEGAYQVILVSNATAGSADNAPATYRQTIISSPSTFTIAAY
jgi:hypothetical protein